MKTADCRKSACMELRTFTNEHGRTETLCNVTGRIPGNCNCPKERVTSIFEDMTIKELESVIVFHKNAAKVRT
jgi:hypothetical protein